jgi:hypothetical protein
MVMTILISDGQHMAIVFLQSLILDERKPNDTGIDDVWQLKFKPIVLIVSPPDINI